MKKNRFLKLLKKIHKWPAIIIAFFAILFATSGIVMNHRGLFSSVDVSRKFLPENYSYKNWNQAAVRGSEKISDQNYLMYGTIGIWETSDNFQSFTDFNQGFPKGTDNRKIYSVKMLGNFLFAGTQLGLYKRGINDTNGKKQIYPLRKIVLPILE